MRAIKAREICLKSLETFATTELDAAERQLDKNQPSSVTRLQEVVSKCSELITHMRVLSLNVVESVIRWRESLLSPPQALTTGI